MIALQESWALYLNILVALIFIFSLVSGYQKGLIKGIISLVRMLIALIAASLLAGPMSNVFPLQNYRNVTIAQVVTDALEYHGSKLIWFVVIFIVAYLATMIIEWAMSFVDSIPIIKSVNRIAGLFFGFILAYFKLYLLLIVLVTPIFRNAQPLIDASYLKYVQNTSGMIDSFANHINESITTQKAVRSEELDTSEAQTLESILESYGLREDQITEYIEGLR
jgi:uncharacterized membrane protein required for colicin V production